MEEWKPNAEKAFTPLAVGAFFQSLGVITGFAAPAIPWMSARVIQKPLYSALYSVNYYYVGSNVVVTATEATAEAGITSSSYSIVNSYGIAGAVIAYVRNLL